MIEQCMKEADHLIRFKAYEAKKTLLPHWTIEDLEQEGRVAALKAYRNYKKDRNILFTTFIFPYLTRTYLSIYDYEACSKRSIRKQLIEDSKEMEEKHVIFPTSYRRGTIYNLDRIFQENDALGDWNEQPVLSEPELQIRSGAEEFEVRDLVEKVGKELDVISKCLLTLIVAPPDDFTSDTVKASSQEYCKYLGITPHKLKKCMKCIKKEVKRFLEK